MAEWFYRLNGADQGPISDDDLKHIIDSGALPDSTPIWKEGMDDWTALRKIDIQNPKPCLLTLSQAPSITNTLIPTEKHGRFLSWKTTLAIILICIGVGVYWKRRVFESMTSSAV